MKKIILQILLVSVFSSITLFSCKKYEQGPAFTLLSKKVRLTGDWAVESLFYGSTDITSNFLDYAGKNYILKINTNETYNRGGNVNESGRWKFEDSKKTLRFSPDNMGVDSYSYTILRLANKELWLENEDSSGVKSVLKLKQ